MASKHSASTPIVHELLGISAQGLWAALAEDCESKAVILSTRGEVLCCNELAARTLRRKPQELIGRPLVGFCPDETHDAITRWLSAVRRSSTSRSQPVATYLIWGCQWHATGRRIRLVSGDDAILCVGRRVVEPTSIRRLLTLVHIFADREMVLGELASLSDRELEVAALIGSGLTDAEIAREIYRSVRTVHAHRRSIGQKLRIVRRAELLRAMVLRGIIAETKPSSRG